MKQTKTPTSMQKKSISVHDRVRELTRHIHVHKPIKPVRTEEKEIHSADDRIKHHRSLTPILDKEKESGIHRKEISKSAKIVKSIYKKHKMVREELYDHEKDDKDGGTTGYGKKPKLNIPKEVNGDGKAQASAVLSGGTTLTGQKRDMVEMDPMLKKMKAGSNNTDASGVKNDK